MLFCKGLLCHVLDNYVLLMKLVIFFNQWCRKSNGSHLKEQYNISYPSNPKKYTVSSTCVFYVDVKLKNVCVTSVCSKYVGVLIGNNLIII